MRLRHGPIDVLLRAEGEAAEVDRALAQARKAFPAILPALCAELPALRAPLPSPPPAGAVAHAMHAAVTPYADRFVTPMAAVAGAVADHLLRAMTAGRTLRTAFVNNGGDIAFHLAPGEMLRCGLVAELAAPALDGVFARHAAAPSRGIATSGRACKGHGGRSFSFGIADAVTVLAATAARADAAATIVANAVDVPGHPDIVRRPACDVDPLTDLGSREIVWEVTALTDGNIRLALERGMKVAHDLIAAGLIDAAVMVLRGRFATCGTTQALEQE